MAFVAYGREMRQLITKGVEEGHVDYVGIIRAEGIVRDGGALGQLLLLLRDI